MFGTVFDGEADGLRPTKIHVLSATVDGQNISSTQDPDKMKEFFLNQEVLVGHNIVRYDIPEFSRVLGIEIPKEVILVDTLALSWYLFPKRRLHGLESWGEEFGVPKPEITDWEGLTYEEYRHRCEEDVKINSLLWEKQYKLLIAIYGSQEKLIPFLRYLAFKMDCARAQEDARWKLDVERAEKNRDKLQGLFDEKTDVLRSVMPPVPVKQVLRRPKSLYKQDGQLSKAGENWVIEAQKRGFDPGSTTEFEIIRHYDEPNPGSVPQIKQWLCGLGWVPQTFKTNEKGVEVPQVNKAKQDGGGVCESVKLLYEKDPNLEHLDSYFVLRHRIGILNGFLSDVSDDGYLVARIQGLTNTLRFKHAEIVNLPKPDAPYGKEIREVLIAPDGYELCGADKSSLEDRLKQHFCYVYDPDYVNEMNVPGYDPHLDLALSAGKVTKQDVENYKGGSYEPWIKSMRSVFKNGNYSAQYGAFPPRIAKTTGISLDEAKNVFDAYWKRNWSIKAVSNAIKTKTVNKEQWLFNPISNFWYSLRNEKDKFSTLVQGSGVYCFDLWVGLVLRDRHQLTASFHDEIVLCVKQGYRGDVEKYLKDCCEEANEILQLNRRLDIEVQFGDRYSDVH